MKGHPTPVLLPGRSHGYRHLEGYDPWGCKRVGYELVTKQQKVMTFPFLLLFVSPRGQSSSQQ